MTDILYVIQHKDKNDIGTWSNFNLDCVKLDKGSQYYPFRKYTTYRQRMEGFLNKDDAIGVLVDFVTYTIDNKILPNYKFRVAEIIMSKTENPILEISSCN